MAELKKRPEIQSANTSFNPNFPQYQIDINVPKCKEAGVSVSSIISTLQGYYGGIYASNFNQFGKQYRVMVQADYDYRTNQTGLSKIFVRNNAGVMAPITTFVIPGFLIIGIQIKEGYNDFKSNCFFWCNVVFLSIGII